MVLIQSLVGAVQLGTALLSEYLKAQGLCRLKRGGVARQFYGQVTVAGFFEGESCLGHGHLHLGISCCCSG